MIIGLQAEIKPRMKLNVCTNLGPKIDGELRLHGFKEELEKKNRKR